METARSFAEFAEFFFFLFVSHFKSSCCPIVIFAFIPILLYKIFPRKSRVKAKLIEFTYKCTRESGKCRYNDGSYDMRYVI